MNILAIETSCDDTSIAIVKGGREVIICETLSQIKRHAEFGGIVPEVASRCHLEVISQIFELVFEKSGLRKCDIDAVAVTYSPGLVGSLLVGVNFAKGVAFSLDVPLIPIDHIKGHIASNYISNKELSPKFICLVVSGGHTNVISVEDYTKTRVMGKTRDDAAGETFDKIGRRLGMPYPAGITLDKTAELGNPDNFNLTIPAVAGSKYDFSFSGIKTCAINIINNLNQKNSPIPIEDICASVRKTVVDYLMKNLLNAAQDLGIRKIALAGGVSANSLLRKQIKHECESRGWQYFMPDLNLCSDNASMIGAQGYYEFVAQKTTDMALNARPNL